MTSASLLLLTLLLPLATGALVVATGRRPDLREAISLLGSALTAVAAALLLWRVADGERVHPDVDLGAVLADHRPVRGGVEGRVVG